jgi:hypothetical protein
VSLNLDPDQDQYLTAAELETAIAEFYQDVAQDRQRARSMDWLRQSRALSAASPERFRQPNARMRPTRDSSVMIIGGDFRKLQDLRFVQERVAMGGQELSLVSDEFHDLFSHLPPEQRHALLEADVEGNNDGTLTVREFYLHNRRVFSKKTHFESDFGESAYLEILRLFDVL